MKTVHISSLKWEQVLTSNSPATTNALLHLRSSICGVSSSATPNLVFRAEDSLDFATCDACILLYLAEQEEKCSPKPK